MRTMRTMIAALVGLALAGCMTTQPLAVDAKHLSAELEPGDRVEIVTKGGQQLQFAVESVDGQGVRGAGQQVAFGDIQSISRSQLNVGRTALIVLGAAAVIAAVAGGGGGGGSGY